MDRGFFTGFTGLTGLMEVFVTIKALFALLAIFNDCFGFTKIDAGAIVRIKNAAVGVGV